MSKIILFLLLLSSLKASAEEIPWYFDNPETAQKASIMCQTAFNTFH
jgi:hypothetical protein